MRIALLELLSNIVHIGHRIQIQYIVIEVQIVQNTKYKYKEQTIVLNSTDRRWNVSDTSRDIRYFALCSYTQHSG